MDKKTKPSDEFRGVDINKADDNKVDPHMVKADTRDLNNNPRNNDIDDD